MLIDAVLDTTANHTLSITISDIINMVIAATAIFGVIISMLFNRKTLRQTKELSDKTLKESKELYDKSIEVEMFDKKYSMITYFMDFFRLHKINKPTDEQLSEFMKNCFLAFIFVEFKNIGNDFGYYVNYIADQNPLPDYRQALKQKCNVDVQDIYIAFCDYMQCKLREAYIELLQKVR